jgi:hypothetical protein
MHEILTTCRYTIDTWTIHTGNQQSNNSSQAQEEDVYGQRGAFSESASDSDQPRNDCELDESYDTAHNRPIGMLEEFDPQFWLTSLGVLSHETPALPFMSDPVI